MAVSTWLNLSIFTSSCRFYKLAQCQHICLLKLLVKRGIIRQFFSQLIPWFSERPEILANGCCDEKLLSRKKFKYLPHLLYRIIISSGFLPLPLSYLEMNNLGSRDFQIINCRTQEVLTLENAFHLWHRSNVNPPDFHAHLLVPKLEHEVSFFLCFDKKFRVVS